MFTTKKTIALLTQGKSRYGIEEHTIAEGAKADLSLFNPDATYTFNTSHILSKSKNSAFLNSDLKGLVYGVISNNKISLK
jgi:dihydroorotase